MADVRVNCVAILRDELRRRFSISPKDVCNQLLIAGKVLGYDGRRFHPAGVRNAFLRHLI